MTEDESFVCGVYLRLFGVFLDKQDNFDITANTLLFFLACLPGFCYNFHFQGSEYNMVILAFGNYYY